jgi:hypothetical protein
MPARRAAGAGAAARDRADGEFLTRVEARFGARPAEWHSGVTMTERRRVWRMVGGGAQLVVGARSALFLPFRDLGLIVVDEEHDTSYKQEDGVLYNARDMAVLRASICGAQVVLASATPSLESWANAEAGKYARLDLTARFGAAVLPEMRAIDMRAETCRGPLDLAHAAARSRRGSRRASRRCLFSTAAAMRRSRSAGPAATRSAAHCDARMVEHRFLKRLVCHQCGETTPMPAACPSCGPKTGWPRSARGGAAGRRGRGAVSRGADRGAVLGPLRLGPRAEGADRGDRAGGGRYHHRHAAGGQGAQLSAADAGGRDRRRSRPAGLGPARRRAHLPADAAGGGPRGAGGKARARRCCRPSSPSIR